ncbi:MAG: hypothetical protein JWM64_2427 [Frankiales bacterium]|nr:hypothetical protein [Frankiales bacterium]
MTLSRRLRSRSARARGDDGFALITAVLTLSLLAAFSLVLLQQTIRNSNLSKKDQDWVSALGAAQAGLDDYLARLNDSDGAYYVYNSTSPDASNAAMGTSGGAPRFAPLATAAGAAVRGAFHYDVDTTSYTGSATATPNGNILVTSTGRVGQRTRTVSAVVRRSGFLDFVYLTDYETQDPSNLARESGTTPRTDCSDYFGARSSTCQAIQFSNDVLSGPVHSNDRMLICDNVTFRDTVTTWATAQSGLSYRTAGCSATSGTTFERGAPTSVSKVSFPSTNLSLKAETGPAASPRGCLYVGPTKIVLKGTQMLVKSPWTKSLTPGCAKDTYFTIPRLGVIYVDMVPTVTTDANYWTASDPARPVCAAGANPVGYPITSETGWSYPCQAGDVFIEEEGGSLANGLNGRLTVSANNDLYITNNIDYAPGTTSFLGLIAEQCVYYWHPVSNSTNLNLPGQSTPFLNARISAALLSVNHAVTVQHYAVGGSLGNLNVTGAITQKFRGVVRQGTAGYAKNYQYDQRLRYDAPPRFLNPTSSSFGAIRTAETAPLYRP